MEGDRNKTGRTQDTKAKKRVQHSARHGGLARITPATTNDDDEERIGLTH